MAKKPNKPAAKVPVKLSVSETSKIVCTGCNIPTDFMATPSFVYVKGKPVLTHTDIKLGLNITPFASCSFNLAGGSACIFTTGTWDTKIEGVTAVGLEPLTVEDKLTCDKMGGEISFFSPGPEQPTVPDNPIDDLKNTINSKINEVTQKVAAFAKGAGEELGAVVDTIKKAGAITKTPVIQGGLDAAGDLVDNIDYQKARLDTGIENINVKIENLKLQLKELLTGQEQDLLKESEVKTRQEKEKEALANKNKEEVEKNAIDLNSKIFTNASQDTLNELFRFLQDASQVPVVGNPNSFFVEEKPGKEEKQKKGTTTKKEPTSLDDLNMFTLPPIIDEMIDISSDYTKKGNDSYDLYSKNIKAYNKKIGLEGAKDSREALRLLHLLTDLTTNSGSKISGTSSSIVPSINLPSQEDIIDLGKGAAGIKIAETRIELDAYAQAKVNELLKEIGYLEAIHKYREESKEIQEDIDEAARALDLVGDFDAFVDGIIAEEAGEFAAKAKKEITKFNKNVTNLNTGLNAASFVAGGFAKGDVFTHVTLESSDESEDEEGLGDSELAAANLDTSALFSDNSAITDDKNEEAKILRMFVIWDQDYEEFKIGELVTVETIPPDTHVCLVIQANKKADGKIVSVDLGDRSTHYEYVGGHEVTVVRGGLFENIILNGDSPDFEKGGKYDISDPDFAIENGVKRQLSDTTKIKLKSVLPPEEEEDVI